MRLIDADALIFDDTDIDETAEKIADMIDDAPTIDSVKHGKWNKKETDGGILGICSECRYPLSWWYKSKFCPNCGADMRTEDA